MSARVKRDQEVERLEAVVASRKKKNRPAAKIAQAEAQLRRAKARQEGRL